VRERLLAAFVGLTLLTVLLYGVPRALTRADAVRNEARADVHRSALIVAEAVELRRQADLPLTGLSLAYLDAQDQVEYRLDGSLLVLRGADRPDRTDDITATAPADGGTVEVRRPRSEVSRDVSRALTPIILTGGVSLAVAVAAAFLLAARLARPFQELAASAASLGAGGFGTDLRPQRVREAEAIAAALRASTAQVQSMLQRERDFARNASHQLRTPLTGMRLRVEDLTLWPETPPAVAQELQEVLSEVDRLSDTVTVLLAFAREEQLGAVQEVSLAQVASAAVQRWQALAGERGRHVVLGRAALDPAALPRIVVDQVLDVLLDNALRHGEGTVTVEVQTEAGRARFLVRDEGAAVVPSHAVFRRRPTGTEGVFGGGEGIGLALCAELATAVGGRLTLLDRSPTTFGLEVPVR
jgi:signal transduction histidine kinase